MKSVNNGIVLAAVAIALPGCAAKQWSAQQYGTNYSNDAPVATQATIPAYAPEYGQASGYAAVPYAGGPVSDTPVKLGAPYDIGGTTYAPEDNPMYDEVGYASWYGQELAGRQTANGEMFNPAGISAAHKTLPLPSYVEVTRIDTGQTILVRVNDRGPFANDRIIDLSEGASRQLGIMDQGAVGVRVRRVSPPESERAALRSGQSAQPRLSTPGELLSLLNDQLMKQPKPAVSPRPSTAQAQPRGQGQTGGGRFIVEGSGQAPNVSGYGTSYDSQYGVAAAQPKRPISATPTPNAGGFVVQVAAFSSRQRADELAARLGANVVASEDGGVYRVRLGPYANEAEAQKALEMVKGKGYSGARVFAN